MVYKRCKDCGANLDPEERCDCKQSKPAVKPKIIIVGCSSPGWNFSNHHSK